MNKKKKETNGGGSATSVAASHVLTLDESMSAYRPQTTKTGNLPNISFILRKPENLGTEMKAVASTSCNGPIIHLEIQEGKDNIQGIRRSAGWQRARSWGEVRTSREWWTLARRAESTKAKRKTKIESMRLTLVFLSLKWARWDIANHQSRNTAQRWHWTDVLTWQRTN